ncbi:hypothetical protein BV20DRAFT_265397 [Pilatotrama ljubarskyi]|nr:hypothetical protein BV20DRAFT_265397 [Pilatotrama ljubarskyi]
MFRPGHKSQEGLNICVRSSPMSQVTPGEHVVEMVQYHGPTDLVRSICDSSKGLGAGSRSAVDITAPIVMAWARPRRLPRGCLQPALLVLWGARDRPRDLWLGRHEDRPALCSLQSQTTS